MSRPMTWREIGEVIALSVALAVIFSIRVVGRAVYPNPQPRGRN